MCIACTLVAELVAGNITEKLLSQLYMQKETGYELRQSGDATNTRKEVTTGNVPAFYVYLPIICRVGRHKIPFGVTPGLLEHFS